MHSSSPSVRPPLIALAAVCLFGTAPVVGQAIPASVPRITVAGLRLAIGGGVLLTVAGRARVTRVWAACSKRRLVLGAFGVAGFQVCFFLAVGWTGAAVASAVSTLGSPIVAGFARPALGRERPGRRWYCACAVGACGTVLLLGAGPGTVRPLGIALALAGGALYAVYALAAPQLEDARDRVAASALVLCLAALLLAPAVVTTATFPLRLSSAASMIWLGLGATALAYALFARSLPAVGPERLLALLLVQPVVSAALAALVFDQPVGLRECGGIALVCASAAIAVPPQLTGMNP